jgi:hypothetical protein
LKVPETLGTDLVGAGELLLLLLLTPVGVTTPPGVVGVGPPGPPVALGTDVVVGPASPPDSDGNGLPSLSVPGSGANADSVDQPMRRPTGPDFSPTSTTTVMEKPTTARSVRRTIDSVDWMG